MILLVFFNTVAERRVHWIRVWNVHLSPPLLKIKPFALRDDDVFISRFGILLAKAWIAWTPMWVSLKKNSDDTKFESRKSLGGESDFAQIQSSLNDLNWQPYKNQ
jgi:hypothetical protein